MKQTLRRITAALLCAAITLTTLPGTAMKVHAAPIFGSQEEDFEYQRLQIAKESKTIAMNQDYYNEYMAFRSANFTNSNQKIYIDFSFPYNTEMSIKVYKLNTDLFYNKNYPTQMQGVYPADGLFAGECLGTVVGSPLTTHVKENADGTFTSLKQSFAVIENNLALLKDPEVLEEVQGYGYEGKNPKYRNLNEYYSFYNLENPLFALLSEPEEQTETESETETEINSEISSETESEIESEIETEIETETETEIKTEISSEVETTEHESTETTESKAPVTSTENQTTEPSSGELISTADAYIPYALKTISENKTLSDNQVTLSENSITKDTVFTSDNVPEELIPEDYFLVGREPNTKQARAAMPTRLIHNYILWDGTVDQLGVQKKLSARGSYLLAFEPTTDSLKKDTRYLPFRIGNDASAGGGSNPGEGGGSEEDIVKFFESMSKNNMNFPTLPIAWSTDPVDLVSGNLLWNYTDLSLNGTNPLAFTRYYNSGAAEEKGSLGYGWSHNYDSFVNYFHGVVNITLPDGNKVGFIEDNGTYKTQDGSAWSFSHKGNGFLLSHTNGERYVFSENGLPESIMDVKGNVTTYTTDGKHISEIKNSTGSFSLTWQGDLIASVTDNAGRSISFGYDGDNLTSVSNPDGDTLQYTYDGSHNLLTATGFGGATGNQAQQMLQNSYNEKHQVISQTIPDLGSFQYSYDEAARTTTHTTDTGLQQVITYDENERIVSDRNNDGTISYTYDDLNRRTSQSDRRGNVTAYAYEGNGTNVVAITHPDGTVEHFTYNSANQVTGHSKRDGSQISYTYDGKGNLTGQTDGEGNTKSYTYDETNYLVSTTDSMGGTTTFVNNAMGNPISITDQNGNTVLYEYDSAGRIVKETSPEGNIQTYAYTSGGKLLEEKDALEKPTAYEYTGNGFQNKKTDRRGNVIQTSYSAWNNVLEETDAEGNKITYTYTAGGNIASRSDAKGNKTAYTYDALDRMTSETDPEGNKTVYTYDAEGNVSSVTSPLGYSIKNGYDSNNLKTSAQDANGNTVVYQYDGMGRLIKETDPVGNANIYTYDKNGNLKTVTNKNGNRTEYGYDKENRLISVTDALSHTTSYSYDAAGRMTQAVLADGSKAQTAYDKDGNVLKNIGPLEETSSFQYDKLGRLLQKTDPLGNVETYTYDEEGNCLSVSDSEGNTIAYEYDRNNRLLKETDKRGAVTTYQYDANGAITLVTDALLGQTMTSYDKNGRILSITDAEGYRTTYAYDADSNVIVTADANGNSTQYTYDATKNLTSIKAPDGGVETIQYDKNNRMISRTDAEGFTWTYGYDANGNQTMETDPKGNTTTYHFDALERKTGVSDALGGEIKLSLDALGRTTSVLNQDGAITEYTYNAAGQLMSMKDALGHNRRFTYDALGNCLSETDENGVLRTYTYDSLNRVVSYTDGKGNTETYEYDKNGNRIRITDKRGNTTRYTYDALNRVIKETNTLGNSKVFRYDKNSRIIGVTDWNTSSTATGKETQYILDGNGNIIEQIDALGHSSYFTYDACNRLIQIKLYQSEEISADGSKKPSKEQITLYTYDKRGLVKTEIDAKQNEKIYVYDEVGNRIAVTDEDGYVTSYTYDALNRPNVVSYDTKKGSKKAVTYYYNKTGEITALEDWNGTTTINRDALNRITSVTDHNKRTTGYTYDAVGNITQLNYPEKDKQAQFAYDAENNQISARDEKGQTFRFSYDANGNITSKQYANNELERYQYDALNQRIRMDEYTLTGIQKTYTAYAYDANGNRTMEQNRVPTTPVRNFQSTTNTGTWGGAYKTYSYDALNRLTKEYEHDTAQSIYYSYDALGNRVTQKDNRDSLTYTYNELNQLVEKKAYNGLTSYVYDKRGNRIKESSQYTQENRRTYEWDETNRLVRGTRGPDYGLYESTYTYNGLGLRVNSTIMGPDKTKYDRDYVIDYTSPERNDIAEYNVGHTQWNGSKRVHDLSYLYNQDGERLEVNVNRYNSWSSEVVKYSLNIHEDIMGSSVCYTRQDSGYNANKHEYTIWGYNTKAPTYNYDPEYRATEPYYTGHPYDGSLNIYFAENRFYDAETGTWLSKDPARSGMNWYVYCESNPGTYVDPLGLVSTGRQIYFDVMGGSGSKLDSAMNSYLFGILAGAEQNVSDTANNTIYMAWLLQRGLPWSVEYQQLFDSQVFQECMEQHSTNMNAYYGGKITSDILLTYLGVKAFVYGAFYTGGSAAGGALLTIFSGGTGAPVTVPVAVTNVAIGAGISVGGVVVAQSSLDNFKEDLWKLQESKGEAETNVPDYKKENRVPLDKETALNGKDYQKTGKKVKGAQVYKKGDQYYYRDTFHTSESAHLEVFDKRGNHLGEADPLTGILKSGTADPTKKININ